MAISERIPDALDGERLDRVVSMIASCSRARSVELIESGFVKIAGRQASSKSLRVQRDQEVVIDDELLRSDRELKPDASVNFEVVFLDPDIVVIDKPSGIVVHPGTGNESGTLVNGLLARFPEIASVGQTGRPGIVHRLDKGTSGLMVVARSQSAYESLVEMLSRHEVVRTYTALVQGSLDSAEGIIEAPIGRSHTHSTQMALSASGKHAVTRYELISRFTTPVPASLIELHLETGRTHQIRVHMKAIGHPLFGDETYSKKPSLGLKRIFLHSHKLEFAHPVSGERLQFSSVLPDDLEDFLRRFK